VLRVLLIAFVVLFLAEFLPAPWAFHIGGRFTPLGQWDGYGPVQASDGGRYLLFTHLQGGVIAHGGRPGCAFHGGCNSLRGSAKLCTESGRVYSFSLSGKLHGWLTTQDVQRAQDLGTALAALKCTMWGDIAVIRPGELEELLAQPDPRIRR